MTSNTEADKEQQSSLIEVPKPYSHPEELFETHIKSYSSLRLETDKGEIINLTCLIRSVSQNRNQNHKAK